MPFFSSLTSPSPSSSFFRSVASAAAAIAAVLAVLAPPAESASPAASATSRIRVDGATVSGPDALDSHFPKSLVSSAAEIEAGLAPALGSSFSVLAFSSAPDLLVVSTVESGRARSIAQQILKGRSLLHEFYLDPPPAPRPSSSSSAGGGLKPDERPVSPLLFEPDFVEVSPAAFPRRALFTSVPLRDGDGEPFEGMIFDVETSLGRIAGVADADPERPGHQAAVGPDGVLAIEIDFPGDIVPRTGLLTASAAADPSFRASATFATPLQAGETPFVTVVYLLRDDPDDFTAVAEFLAKRKSNPITTGLALEQWTNAKGKTFPVIPVAHFAYPMIAIVPDRKQKGDFERWQTDNQAVHQAMHPMVAARFGTLPYWADEAIAWDIEEAVCGSIWSFCGYRGFVFDSDHKNWAARAREGLRTPADLKLDEVFAYRGEPVLRKAAGSRTAELTFDIVKFARAWALVRALSRSASHRSQLRRFLLRIGADPTSPIDFQSKAFSELLPDTADLAVWKAIDHPSFR